MYTLAPSVIKEADKLATEKYGISGLTLMKNAAKSCFDIIFPLIRHDSKIAIICGKGNNGGDGYELASLLKREYIDVNVIKFFGCEPQTGDALAVYKDYIGCGGNVISADKSHGILERADVIIDALFGVGFYGSIEKESDCGKILEFCNSLDCKRIAIDVPSGINSADGSVTGVAFKAHLTLTMAYIKTGMISYPAKEYCGKILTADIGYPKNLCDEIRKDALVPDDEFVKSIIPKSPENSHKGTFGRLMMFCASPYMTGAGVLAATAALRSGVGLVNIVRDSETLRILQTRLTEPIFSPVNVKENGSKELILLSEKASAILIGCGLGCEPHDKTAVYDLIKNASCPIILDADGINAVSENIMVLKEAKQTPILTPHPLEFARLCNLGVEKIQQNRIALAKEFAKEYGCVLVLKGAGSIIASPDGRIAVNTSGNPGLSKGGSGDVLAGLCASLMCRGISAFDCACASVYLHGKAADILKKEISEMGFLPSDLPLAIAKLLP